MTVIVQNRYFVTDGFEAEALNVRRNATAVRAEAGRPTGRIILSAPGLSDAPTFIWECEYPDFESRDIDAAWADESPEFTAVRQRMGRLLDNFERHAFEVISDTA